MFDPKCHELAAAFLEDETGINSAAKIDDLAQTIQSAIESWIEFERYDQEPRQREKSSEPR
jgi:hypothetical protein